MYMYIYIFVWMRQQEYVDTYSTHRRVTYYAPGAQARSWMRNYCIRFTFLLLHIIAYQ